MLFLGVAEIAAAQSWVYYDIRESKNQFLLQSNPHKSAWMDIEGDAEFCGKGDNMLCFKAEKFQFAVPRKPLEVGAEWLHNGNSYRVEEKGRRNLLGKTYSVFFIDTKFEKFHMRFVYSREAGLLAITTIHPTPGLLLILDGACGFGAPASCHRH